MSFACIFIEDAPPSPTSIIFCISFFVFSIITFNFSLFSYFNSSISKFATSNGVFITIFLLFIGLPILFAISQTAFNCIAFTFPIPFIFVSSSIDISAKNLKLLFSLLNINTFCANCNAVSSFVPVFIIIANSSELDNVLSPYISSFSYGLSDKGNCFKFIDIYVPFLSP